METIKYVCLKLKQYSRLDIKNILTCMQTWNSFGFFLKCLTWGPLVERYLDQIFRMLQYCDQQNHSCYPWEAKEGWRWGVVASTCGAVVNFMPICPVHADVCMGERGKSWYQEYGWQGGNVMPWCPRYMKRWAIKLYFVIQWVVLSKLFTLMSIFQRGSKVSGVPGVHSKIPRPSSGLVWTPFTIPE